MNRTLYLVTGAPGAGKTATLAEFIGLDSQFIAFDIDWLTVAASNLAGKDIMFEASTWPAYNALWFVILQAIYTNHHTPVLFAPLDPRDLARDGQPSWCDQTEWLLLDCDDDLRRLRLKQRPEWTEARIEEALADARVLRQTIPTRIDTGVYSPNR